jgi:DNA modification methylase
MNWNGLDLPEPYYQDDAVYIINADCREVLPLIPDKSIDLVLTDPPYGINANRMTLGTGRHNFHRGGKWDDERPIDIIKSLLDMDTFLCLWGGNYYTDILPISNKWLVWHKLNDGLSFSEAEMAWTNYSNNIRVYSKYVANQVKLHPTEKPVSVITWCLMLAPPSVSIILDPFLGSGTTTYCAKKLNRKCIGIEIKEKYCEIAAQRCSQAVFDFSDKQPPGPSGVHLMLQDMDND